MAEVAPIYGIVANVVTDKALRTGAKVWIEYCNGDAEYPFVRGLSKSGRPIEKYTAYKKLTNFRAAWVPPNMRERMEWAWQEKATAEKLASELAARWQK